MRKRLAALVGVVVLIGALSPAAALAAKPHTHKPAEVRTSRDGAKDKIHPKLRKLIDAGSTANVYVFATVAGDPKAAGAMLGNVHVATTPNKEASLVIGRAKPGQLVQAGRPAERHLDPPGRAHEERQPAVRSRSGRRRCGPQQRRPQGRVQAAQGQGGPVRQGSAPEDHQLRAAEDSSRSSTPGRIASPRPGRPATPAKARSCPSSTAARTSGTRT